jgi:hypothetical protein
MRFATIGAAALILIASGLPMLTACNTAPLVPPSSQVVAAKADYVFALAVNTAQNAYLDEVSTLSPATKAEVKPILDKALAAALAARSAEKLGDAATLADQASAAMALAGQAWAILKPGTPFPVTGSPTAPAPATPS